MKSSITIPITYVLYSNVGTVLRKSFGDSLRSTLDSNPELFDRISIMKKVIPDLKDTATKVIDLLGQ